MTKRISDVSGLRFTSALVYFALSLFSTHLTSSMSIYLSTFVSGAIEVPVNVVAFFVVSRRPFGRRLSGCMSFAIAGVACFLCAVTAKIGECVSSKRQCDSDVRSWNKRCNNTISYEFLWIRSTRDYI